MANLLFSCAARSARQEESDLWLRGQAGTVFDDHLLGCTAIQIILIIHQM